jgi:L,D-transpeptidase YcbB
MLWLREGRLTPQADSVLTILRHVEDYGLAPEDFSALLQQIDAENREGRRARLLDDLMSAATLRLIRQLHQGRVDPAAAGYGLRHRRAPLDGDSALRRVAGAADVTVALSTFEPRPAQYRALKGALARYRRLAPDLPSLPPMRSRRLEIGDSYDGAGPLRRLLGLFGDLPADAATASSGLMDADLAAAVARFQRRHGLAPDGVVGAKTFAALAVPGSRRVRQIELTLERWRWLPDIEPPAVIVNVPQFMLYALPEPSIGAATAALKIPVIVGQAVRQTPVFDSAIESVVFRPYWNVPDSILRDELLPLLARDPGYLASHDLEIVRGPGDDAQVLPADHSSVAELRAGRARLRQRPGDRNALGLIKFVLPNPYSVFLHSTPEKQLFSRERRAFSHGCIRVSDAGALAAYLLADTPGDWSPDAVEAATCGADNQVVRLSRPVPVFVLYGTVVIDTDGSVLFFDDVYGYDRRLEALLAARGAGG